MSGTFPPSGPSGTLGVIPSYLYQQYNDDDDLQAFVSSFNTMAQQYVDWLNEISLPVYTGAIIAGPLLDWVAEGLYGISRPTLSTGAIQIVGLFNSYLFNQMLFNSSTTTGSITIFTTNDDLFKRIITWHFYKGDGKYFTIRWLKRRINRFMLGINGTNPNVSDTSSISVGISGTNVTIIITVLAADPVAVAVATFFQAAVHSQVVELPFQYAFSVTVNAI